MSSASAIDWPSIRAAAVAVGVREAARRAAVHLPDNERERFVFRVLKRSQREGWVVSMKSAMAAPVTRQAAKAMSSNVLTGGDVLMDVLAERRDETRLGLSAFVARVSTEAGESGELGDAQDVRHVAAIAAHVWPHDAGGEGGLSLLSQINITLHGE